MGNTLGRTDNLRTLCKRADVAKILMVVSMPLVQSMVVLSWIHPVRLFQSTPQWSDIQNIPSDFSDGVDNDVIL